MIIDWLQGATNRECAAEYGIHPNTVTAILRDHGVTKKERQKIAREPVREDFIEGYRQLGDQGETTTQKLKWIFDALALSAHQLLTDRAYPAGEAGRRKELREIATALSKVRSEADIQDALDQLAAFVDGVDREQPDPGVQPAAPSPTKTRRGKPKRG